MARVAVWSNDEPLVIAHRGGLELAPENTMDAFRSAVAMGVTFLETDVHVTADGVLVAFHDEDLDRVTDGTGSIADLPYSVVAQAKLPGGRTIPTLDELVEEFPEVRLNIDVKADAAVVPFADAVRRHGIVERIGVGAFSDTRIRRLRTLIGPRLSTIASPRETSALVAAAKLRRVDPDVRSTLRRGSSKHPFDSVQVPVSQGPVTLISSRLVNYLHSQGLLIHAWTINDRDEMIRLLDLGVDGLITDRPGLLREVLSERGQMR